MYNREFIKDVMWLFLNSPK